MKVPIIAYTHVSIINAISVFLSDLVNVKLKNPKITNNVGHGTIPTGAKRRYCGILTSTNSG